MLETLHNHVNHLRSKDVYVIKSMAQVDDDDCAYIHIIFYLLFAHF